MGSTVDRDRITRTADLVRDLQARMAGEGYRFDCGYRSVMYYRHQRTVGERAFVIAVDGTQVVEVAAGPCQAHQAAAVAA